MTVAELDTRLRELAQQPARCICGRDILEDHPRIDDAEGVAWHLACALVALSETRRAIAAHEAGCYGTDQSKENQHGLVVSGFRS